MRSNAAGFTLLEIMVVILILGLIAAIAVPSYIKYLRRSKTSEATMNLRKMFDASVAYYQEEHAGRLGAVVNKQFPDSVGPTPSVSCCGQPGDKCAPDPGAWQASASWNALNFAVLDPHYYSYTYESSGTGTEASFTARANGDLNCNGTFSTYERIGSVDAGGQVGGGSGIYKNLALE